LLLHGYPAEGRVRERFRIRLGLVPVRRAHLRGFFVGGKLGRDRLYQSIAGLFTLVQHVRGGRRHLRRQEGGVIQRLEVRRIVRQNFLRCVNRLLRLVQGRICDQVKQPPLGLEIRLWVLGRPLVQEIQLFLVVRFFCDAYVEVVFVAVFPV